MFCVSTSYNISRPSMSAQSYGLVDVQEIDDSHHHDSTVYNDVALKHFHGQTEEECFRQLEEYLPDNLLVVDTSIDGMKSLVIISRGNAVNYRGLKFDGMFYGYACFYKGHWMKVTDYLSLRRAEAKAFRPTA